MILSKLDLLVRYWELAARHARQGEPLGAGERTELLGLMHLVGDQEVPPPMPIARPADAHPAELIGDGSIRSVELRAVSATAIFVCAPAGSRAVASVGSSVVLRAVDAVAGVEYSVPCRVAWVHGTELAPHMGLNMALVVDGAPHRARFSGTEWAPSTP